MNAPDTRPKKPGSPPWKLTPASAGPLAALLLGKVLCRLGAPLVNLGWELREWAAARLNND